MAGTSKIVSYMEARKGGAFTKSIFFGLQPYLKMLEGKAFTRKDIKIAENFAKQHFGSKYFNKKGWTDLYNRYGGVLPIRIKALPEGTLTDCGTALLVIENLDPDFPWLTNFLETLLMKVWYTVTIATNSFYCKKLIKGYMEKSCDTLDALNFALHDFGYRGVSSEETAGLGGMAHLTNFMGTDTMRGIIFANMYYNIHAKKESDFKMYGFSVSASEHSTATPFGMGEGEYKYIEQMLNAYPNSIVSMVADSYDVFDFAKKLAKYKVQIMRRDGRVVMRPDSGDPVEVNVKLLQILSEEFGYTVNTKGYKVLPTQIRIIQGDGIDYKELDRILKAVLENGFAAENLVFGSGGGLLQKFNRDTLRFAIKCCLAVINDVEVNVQKNPKTDKSKSSKSGWLKTVEDDGKLITISSNGMSPEEFEKLIDQMLVVFEMGEIKIKYDFDEVKAKIESYLYDVDPEAVPMAA